MCVPTPPPHTLRHRHPFSFLFITELEMGMLPSGGKDHMLNDATLPLSLISQYLIITVYWTVSHRQLGLRCWPQVYHQVLGKESWFQWWGPPPFLDWSIFYPSMQLKHLPQKVLDWVVNGNVLKCGAPPPFLFGQYLIFITIELFVAESWELSFWTQDRITIIVKPLRPYLIGWHLMPHN